MDYKQMEQSKMASLPIMKHFNAGEIQLNPQKWRKGEGGLYTILLLLAFAASGYLLWVYVLPIIGMMLQLAVVGGFLILLVMARGAIAKVFRSITRSIHKAAIKYDPFGELEEQKQKMIANKTKFHEAKGKIAKLKNDMKVEAAKQEEAATKLQGTIEVLAEKSRNLKEAKDKVTDKESDEYIDIVNESEKTVAESERAVYLYNQAKDFTEKYGTRGNVLGKLDTKLKRVANKIDIKIMDFDTTIQILRNDYEFAEKARQATDAAKSAMLFDTSWELDYAMDVITSTIATDLSITQSNLTDIDSITSNFSIDDAAMFNKLEKIANNIRTGDEVIPSAKKYDNPEYKLTENDKKKSGGFGDMF